MITWFDALLVTLWAIVTALGARRGLAGFVWGVGGLLACFLANLLGREAISATILALLLGGGVALATGRLAPHPNDRSWHPALGALGGFLLGGLLVATLTLGFPTGVQVGPQGRVSVYPSSRLPDPLYVAVRDSVLKDRLKPLWGAGSALQLLVLPDQVWERR